MQITGGPEIAPGLTGRAHKFTFEMLFAGLLSIPSPATVAVLVIWLGVVITAFITKVSELPLARLSTDQ